jgi:outer membrane protein TolC
MLFFRRLRHVFERCAALLSRCRFPARLALVAGLSGCAAYAPLPLSQNIGARSTAQLSAPLTDMPRAGLSAHRFDPSDGLDVTEVAMLAVANSPELKLKRDGLGLSRAQAFAAGLLPDPQLALAEDFPHPSGAGLTTAYSFGLSEDIGALLTRSTRVAAARAQASQVNLDLLWAEWQTVAQARLLFDQVLDLREKQALLEHELRALAPVGQYVRMALRAGNLTYDAASAGLNAESDLAQRRAANTIALHQAESDLHGLLGLAGDAPLSLAGAPYRPMPTDVQTRQALAELPHRRPDLLALQAGYRAQEASVRGAIRAQFPALTLGFTRARDTSNISTSGFSIGISLPLFDRNRGNIAIAQATRQQLHDDYAARLLTAANDVQRLRADLRTLDQQRRGSTAHARELDAARRSAERAWQARLLDWPTYLAIRSGALAADLDLLDVQQEQARQAIALQALLGNTGLAATPPGLAPAHAASSAIPAQVPTP